MSQVRFNHVFVFLMLTSVLSAFVLPRGASDSVRGTIDNLFIPISLPVRGLAQSVNARFAEAPPAPKDGHGMPRSLGELQQEIDRRDVIIAHQVAQLEELRKRDKAQEEMGDLRDACRAVQVWGGDAGARQTLSLRGSTLDGLGNGMAVIYPHGLVGKIELAGIGAARVRLITDANFVLAAAFGRFMPGGPDGKNGDFSRVETPAFTVAGDGHGRMLITNLLASDVTAAGLKKGDWVTLSDHDGWPSILQGYKVGEIDSIREQDRHPLFAEIVVKPDVELMKLKEVMVVAKK